MLSVFNVRLRSEWNSEDEGEVAVFGGWAAMRVFRVVAGDTAEETLADCHFKMEFRVDFE